MKAEITKRTDTTVTFKITAEPKDIEHARQHVYDHLRGEVRVSGFRPGKAPDNIVERELGAERIQAETVEHAVSHAYSDAVFEHRLTVIAQPQVDVKKWVPYTDLEFEATVEIVPEVKLPDYKKIKKQVKPVKIENKQIDEVIEDLRRRLANRAPAVRAAETGDEVKFDFHGTKDGQDVAGASAKNHVLKLGSGQFIPGFEDELIGMKAGEGKTFTITFPKDYHESTLAGQPVEFTIKLQEVTELQLPEIDDKFAAQVGPFKTVADLKADIKDQLTVEGEEQAKRDFENELLNEIITKTKVAVPEKLLFQQSERLKNEMTQRLASSGLTMEQYLKAQNQTQEDFEAEIKPEAERRTKLAMILSQVAKEEDLAVSAEEVDNELDQLRLRYTDPAMQKELAGDRIREDVFNHLMATRTIDKLAEYAKKG
ncbi:MAG TPA: trigger factor [Candidatus Saccharimonadales bacterium]|nr:trigger factor [Candidatus Saccharimonadales bacterium]